MPTMLIIQQLLSFFFCFTLVATSLAKARSAGVTYGSISANLNVLPVFAKAITWGVCVGEMTLAGAILTGWWPTLTALALAAMFVTFGGYQLFILHRGQSSCGCAGSTSDNHSETSTGHAVANLLMAGAALGWGALASASRAVTSSAAAFGCLAPLFFLAVGALRSHRTMRST